MYDGFYGWSLETVEKGIVETKYQIEYISDKKTWEKFLKTEDIELYSKKEYDNIGNALSFYMVHLINNKCFDIKMWEQIFVNGEMVLEQFIKPKSTTKYCMMEALDKEMRSRITRAETETQLLNEELSLYQNFVSGMGEGYKDAFKKYKATRE